MSKTLDELLQVGNEIEIIYQSHEVRKTRVISIRAIIDLGMYVFCWRGNGWNYDIKSRFYFEAIEHRLEFIGVSEEYDC